MNIFLLTPVYQELEERYKVLITKKPSFIQRDTVGISKTMQSCKTCFLPCDQYYRISHIILSSAH